MEEFEIGKRAKRIHHKERLRKKRIKYWGGIDPTDKRRIGIAVNTPTVCNCWMCSNPRTPSIQELSQSQPKLQDLEIPSCNYSEETV